MASLNKILLIGNAGKDCDLRYTANGTATATFSLAVNHRRRGASGEWEDQTEWFNIVLFADQAERLAQYITKGKPLYVEGRQQTRTWDDDAGVKHYRTEVIANTIQLLGSQHRDDGRDVPPPEYPEGRTPAAAAARYDEVKARNQERRAARDIAGGDFDDMPFE